LALAIAAARAATYAGFSLATVAAELDDARHGLDMFTGSDRATNARAVFSWSYRTLRPAAATLFRLLTLHPGPDAGIGAVSSLAGLPVGETRVLLAELLDANLLGEQPAARFRYHDLLRAYGRELAHQLDTAADRRAAEHRVLDHYLHTALAADRLLYPHRPPIRHVTAPLVRGVTPEPLADMAAALAWFTTEYQNLRAAVERAATAGFGTHAWLLPWTLATFLERQGNDRDWLACIQIGLSAAERSGDRAPQALAHYGLGYANLAGGHPDLARTHLTTARDLCRELGDLGQLARVHLNLGVAARMQGRYADALDEAGRALEIYLGLDDPIGQARALNNMGWCHITLGNHDQAMSYCQRAVAMHEAAGNQSGAAHSWDSVGHVHHHTGRHRDAIDCYQRALNLFRELGDRPFEAIIWTHLGDTHAAAGDAAAAREARLRALDIFTEIDHPDADRLRATLRGEPDPTKTERAPPARTGLRHW
jgi:tetratricopeptide (TPR) repeat protein